MENTKMTLQLTGTTRSGSPALSLSGGNSSTFAWSPFGGGTARTGTTLSLPGFNGERQDPLSGVTHLGNGYRAYSPALRRFTCPDSASPFGIGGINPYVYCDHDPVNNTDPSGHGPITWIIRKVITLGVRLGMASAETAESAASVLTTMGAVETGTVLATQISTGIAKSIAQARGNTVAAQELGWIMLGMGIAGGFGLLEGDIGRTLRRLRVSTKSYKLTEEVSTEVSDLFGAEGNYKKIGDDVSEVQESLMEESSHGESGRSSSPIRASSAGDNLVNNAEFSLSDRNGNVERTESDEIRSFEESFDKNESMKRSQSHLIFGETRTPGLPEDATQAFNHAVEGATFDPGERSTRSRNSGRHSTDKKLRLNTLHSWANRQLPESGLKPATSRYIYLP